MNFLIDFRQLVNALVFSSIGLVVLWVFWMFFDKMTPGNIWKEIIEEQNVAVAIVVGAMALGVATIIGSAIHG